MGPAEGDIQPPWDLELVFFEDTLEQLLEGEIRTWKVHRGSSTLETKSQAAQLSSKASRGLGHDHRQAVGTAGPKVVPAA